MNRSGTTFIWILLLVAVWLPDSLAQRIPPRQFPPGLLQRLEDLPEGDFKTRVERLPAPARERAFEWLNNFHFTEGDLSSLRVDDAGAVYYADDAVVEALPTASETEPLTGSASVPVELFPAGLVFHSRPGSQNVLYLDFDGEDVSGTAWNNSLGRDTIPARAYSKDSDYSTFSDAEQLAIKRVWQQVSEDLASFDIDVTTERPSSMHNRVAHALITPHNDANGEGNPSSGGGGVAYINVFGGSSYSNYRPAWVYSDNLSNNEAHIAEAVAHEIGHNFGLSHDGTSSDSYYDGHGSGDTSWGAIMGASYNKNVTQWSDGSYYDANNTQDDLQVIEGKLTVRLDDHGNSRGSATALSIENGSTVTSTTPATDTENSNPYNKGVVERSDDVDMFYFATGSGSISLSVTPNRIPNGRTQGGNLDLLLELYDESGVLIFSDNSASQTAAKIEGTLAEGIYYLTVKNSGAGQPLSSSPSGYTDYGSIGQYFISGTVVPSGIVIPPSAELTVTDIDSPGVPAKQFTVTYTDNLSVYIATIDDNDIHVSGPNGYAQFARRVSVSPSSNNPAVVVTYEIDPPNGNEWVSADEGTYILAIVGEAVGDTEGEWVAAQELGQFTVSIPVVIYSENMDSDPGFALENQWEYGSPAYSQGGPTSGFTGSKILGYNLSGEYASRLSKVYATTPAIEASQTTSLTLKFRRWLELRNGDTANIQVSEDGVYWSDIWTTSSSTFDVSWEEMEYTLPEWLAGSSTVYIRWGLESNQNRNEIGWNLDDIQLLASGMEAPVSYSLQVSVDDENKGAVDPSVGYYSSGESVQVTAAPAAYFEFSGWSGDASGSENPISVIMNSDKTIQANFTELVTSTYQIPYSWLASHGVDDDFENAEQELGANGLTLWQSYIAGLNPMDENSKLMVDVRESNDGANWIVEWDAVAGRRYTVLQSSNLISGFTPAFETDASSDSSLSFEIEKNIASELAIFKLEVALP